MKDNEKEMAIGLENLEMVSGGALRSCDENTMPNAPDLQQDVSFISETERPKNRVTPVVSKFHCSIDP